jgi:glycosyltransferase involved in cell wall biosynthesis
MSAELARAGVMTLLSDYEAHPVAVMEALALARPVVVLETSGLTELARAGWARGVAADASDEVVADALVAQLADPIVADRDILPTWQSCVAELDGAYRDALAAGGR